MSVFAVSAALAALPSLAYAYSFEFTNTPSQCQDLSLKITGSGGQPPYEVLIVPFGPNPVQNEVRKITRQVFPNNADSTSFKLPFPANSQFIAVVSDASGFGTGGTSTSVAVKESSDSSCFDASQTPSAPPFVFNIDPPNTIVQCQPTRIWWDKTKVQGKTQFQGVIPGGQSFSIPAGSLSDVDFKGTGFDWLVNIRASTSLLVVAGDERGMGSAGSADYTVAAGTNPDSSCINATSPSNTPGSPAGGSYQTGISGGGTDGGGGSNTGAIVGGVIGGVVALVIIGLVALFLFRRQKLRKAGGQHPVDLLQGDEGEGNQNARAELPQYYEPEPFIVPDPTIASQSDDGHGGTQRPMSMATTSDGHLGLLGVGAATSASGSSTGRKSAMGPRSFRAVNIIQHDDAGPPEPPKADEIETVELPPAYTNLRQ